MNEFEQKQLPNASAVLILGILTICISFLGCCCYGITFIPALILGIIALVLFKKDKAKYDLSPGTYANYSNLNTGRILAIVGIALSLLILFVMLYSFYRIGLDALQDPELMRESMDDWL